MGLLYSLSIRLYGFAIWLAGFFNPKAKAWLAGRKNWRANLHAIPSLENCIWIHCASLGEFEQGRPLIEEIKSKYPGKKILLTFYSPSGYEIRKDYALTDHVCYLPLDTQKNARDFVAITKPQMALFVKYEVWHHLFSALHSNGIPTYLVSAIFRPSQVYFKPWGTWFQKSLKNASHIFTQDDGSKNLLNQIGINHVSVAGDTRFDRVLSIANHSKSDDKLAKFSKGHFTIVAGSTWPEDEAILLRLLEKNPSLKAIIAPHETNQKRINAIVNSGDRIARWSDTEDPKPEDQIIVLDTIGLLSSAYKYGTTALIGGGFGKGIHNTLEAAVYGIPVFFGPNYQKFKEAKDLITGGGGIEITSQEHFENCISQYIQNDGLRQTDGKAAGKYVASNAGATDRILNHLSIDTSLK